MFYRGYPLLNNQIRPEAIPAPKVPGALGAWAREAARRAMSRDLPVMRVSESLQDPAGWRRIQLGRRAALEALMLCAPEKAQLTRALDIIGLIIGEATWSENLDHAPFDDERHPQIDFQSAETAALLGWLNRAWGDELPAVVRGKMLYETRRRVFAPFLAHDDYAFMHGQGHRPLCIVSDVMVSAVLLERDEARRASLVKQALRLLDVGIAARENRVVPLADAAADTAAVTDVAALLRRLSRGKLDLTEIYPTSQWLDELLFSWLEDAAFVDPAGATLHPELSGAELFRIGLAAGDEAVTALGASLDRRTHLPSQTLTGRVLDLTQASMLNAETRQPPRIKATQTTKNRVMVSRMEGLTCALHTGGGAGNAGAILLYAQGEPVLVEIPGSASLPLIAAQPQLVGDSSIAIPGDVQAREGQEQLTAELTQAYPAEAGIQSYQRTAMVLRREGMLRLIDAIELMEPAAITFRFITPQRPQETQSGLRLGPVEMSWEDHFSLKVVALSSCYPENTSDGQPLYRIELSCAPVQRAYFGFTFAPLGA